MSVGAPAPWREPSGSPLHLSAGTRKGYRSDPWRSPASDFSQHPSRFRRTMWYMREPEAAPHSARPAAAPSASQLRDMALHGGDDARDAFRALWDGYYRRLSAFAAAYRGLPAADRHDAVADALIAAFKALPSFDPRRQLSPWIYRIAANRFSDAARRAARDAVIPVGPSAGPEPLPAGAGGFPAGTVDPPAPGDHAAESADRDLAARCRVAVAALPDIDRRIAMLRFYEDFSAADIGKALGMPAGTVRWRISAIRSRVRAAVGEDAR